MLYLKQPLLSLYNSDCHLVLCWVQDLRNLQPCEAVTGLLTKGPVIIYGRLGSGSNDKCCGKIDLFRVQKMVVHILSWWACCQVYQTEGLFHERWPNFWLFWYQIYDSTSNRTNFTQFWRPENYQFFKPWTGQFSCDTRQMTFYMKIFHDPLIVCWKISMYFGG